MSANISATLESRLKNNKDLASTVKNYSSYQPTAEDIKKENLEQFVNSVEDAILPFKNAKGAVAAARIVNNENQMFMIKTSKDVRLEVLEIKGNSSPEYLQVNQIVRKITGENMNRHSINLNKKKNGLKEGEQGIVSSSVSFTDMRTRTGNFRELIELLKNFPFYNPSDSSLSVESLETICRNCDNSINTLTDAESKFINERSRIIHHFDDKGGLRDRAVRAKAHVKRKYGTKSPEYKALVNKKY